MGEINDEKLKMMEDEMNRFEEEIGLPNLPLSPPPPPLPSHSRQVIGAGTYNRVEQQLAADIPEPPPPSSPPRYSHGPPPMPMPPPPPPPLFIPHQVQRPQLQPPMRPMGPGPMRQPMMSYGPPSGHMPYGPGPGAMGFHGPQGHHMVPHMRHQGPPPHMGQQGHHMGQQGPMGTPNHMGGMNYMGAPGSMPPHGFSSVGPGPMPINIIPPPPPGYDGPAPDFAPPPPMAKPAQLSAVLSATPKLYASQGPEELNKPRVPTVEIPSEIQQNDHHHNHHQQQQQSQHMQYQHQEPLKEGNNKKGKKNKGTNKDAADKTKSNMGISGHDGGSSKKKDKKNKKLIRTAGGQTWEDPSLGEWEDDDFRLFCGDLGNDVTDEILNRAFSKYPSFLKAKVVRDKRSNKTKGFGFVSFKDPQDFIRATKEMNGRYVGSRPIKLRKSMWRNRSLDVVRKKEKEKTALIGLLTGR